VILTVSDLVGGPAGVAAPATAAVHALASSATVVVQNRLHPLGMAAMLEARGTRVKPVRGAAGALR